MAKVIETLKAPAPIGPYSQAVLHNNTLYVSGQIALNPETGKLVLDSLEEETHMVMKNLKAVLEAAEFTLNDVVKCSIFIMDMADFSVINEIYGGYFYKSFPARETVQVAGLPKGVRVEISCIAAK